MRVRVQSNSIRPPTSSSSFSSYSSFELLSDREPRRADRIDIHAATEGEISLYSHDAAIRVIARGYRYTDPRLHNRLRHLSFASLTRPRQPPIVHLTHVFLTVNNAVLTSTYPRALRCFAPRRCTGALHGMTFGKLSYSK